MCVALTPTDKKAEQAVRSVAKRSAGSLPRTDRNPEQHKRRTSLITVLLLDLFCPVPSPLFITHRYKNKMPLKRKGVYSDGEPFRKSKIGRWMQYHRKVTAKRGSRALVKAQIPKYALTRNLTSNSFPSSKRQTLVYATRQSLTPNGTVGLIGGVQFRLNSCFDPQVAIGGIQPYGFDQWMAIYKTGMVVSTKAKLSYTNANANQAGACGMFIQNSDSAVTTAENQAITSQYSTWKPWSFADGAQTMTLSWDAGKYFNLNNVTDEADLQFTTGADCLKQAYITVWASGFQVSSGAGTFVLELAYDIVFTEPREVGES